MPIVNCITRLLMVVLQRSWNWLLLLTICIFVLCFIWRAWFCSSRTGLGLERAGLALGPSLERAGLGSAGLDYMTAVSYIQYHIKNHVTTFFLTLILNVSHQGAASNVASTHSVRVLQRRAYLLYKLNSTPWLVGRLASPFSIKIGYIGEQGLGEIKFCQIKDGQW